MNKYINRKYSYIFPVAVLIFVIIITFNYIVLQRPFNEITSSSSNKGISAWVHYSSLINSDTLVFDLRGVSVEKSMADVTRVLLQYSSVMKNKNFKWVRLQYRGKDKFLLDGEYFKKLGQEFDYQNPVYTIRTFPENLLSPDGTKAYPTWEGGIIGVLNKQLQDYNAFHTEWYIKDMVVK